MSPEEAVDGYFAAWNETDAAKREELIRKSCSEDVAYMDPNVPTTLQGHAALIGFIELAQKHFAGHKVMRHGPVASHHGRFKVKWTYPGPDGVSPFDGIDFGDLDADGRIAAVAGFVD